VILLRELLSDFILDEESEAARQAKTMGLISKGFGRWADQSGTITHKTDNGKLVPVNDKNTSITKQTTATEPTHGPVDGGESNLKKMGIVDFKSLFNKMPRDLQTRVYDLKNQPQRADHHPEGNVLKHTIVAVHRSLKDDDIDVTLAAMFHDMGKDATAGIHPKKGHVTHFGHEKVSTEVVQQYRNWIGSVGGDVDTVAFIVKNHMRFKNMSDMRPAKQNKLKSHPSFDKLVAFSKHDRGGFKNQ
jgi:hypothetical protein